MCAFRGHPPANFEFRVRAGLRPAAWQKGPAALPDLQTRTLHCAISPQVCTFWGAGRGRPTPKPCDEHYLPAERHRPPQTPKLMRMMRARGAPKSTPQVRLQKYRFERSNACWEQTETSIFTASSLIASHARPSRPRAQPLKPQPYARKTTKKEKRDAR